MELQGEGLGESITFVDSFLAQQIYITTYLKLPLLAISTKHGHFKILMSLI